MKQSLIDFWKENKIIKSKKLLDAFKKTPREDFILKEHLNQTYTDIPLPILEGQTISQPTTIMLMTQALEVREGQKVLEIGTGSGYQAAILSELVGKKGKVFTLEIIQELVKFSRKNLKNYKNVQVIESDGSLGYEKEAPYDKIIVTATCPEIPKKLLEQLKFNGILVVPVGKFSQEMLVIKKEKQLQIKNLGSFVFVPLRGKYGF